ncbi:CYFA0S01e01156g1_1 [Cyberlindnera fabianii]|uniref:DASH complex subunit DAD3 n=1 Tax=Cyberlindnera fabianii TaxID=36022 RepID=A0A061AFP1_CYBFA|nr:DASH complex subunit DAD3 [Cyberlindnera fabianii]CDR36397.1 CYFA0S01e01156g1_1 [Cyberlindnera fabianii]
MSEILTTDFSQSTQLSELELKILQRYQTLALRLNHLSAVIDKLISQPTPQVLENLRVIESKIALVFTLFKAAVYSLFLQQEGAESNTDMDALHESTASFIS